MMDLFNRMRAVPVTKPVFIIGCGRSGTTLLFNLLKGHPGLAPTTGHPDGEDHVGWIEHGGAVIAGLATPAGDSGHVGYHVCPYMDELDVSEETKSAMHRYYATQVLKGRKGLRVVNKCPHLSNKLRYVRAIFADALFIQIVRDPVAMTASWVNIMKAVPELMLFWPDSQYPCFWVLESKGASSRSRSLRSEPQLYPSSLRLFADYWTATNGNIPRQLGDSPSQLLTVSYENLVASPREELRRITDFCDLPPLSSLPVEIEENRNQLRRDLLADGDIEMIRERVKTVAAQFGYAATPA